MTCSRTKALVLKGPSLHHWQNLLHFTSFLGLPASGSSASTTSGGLSRATTPSLSAASTAPGAGDPGAELDAPPSSSSTTFCRFASGAAVRALCLRRCAGCDPFLLLGLSHSGI